MAIINYKTDVSQFWEWSRRRHVSPAAIENAIRLLDSPAFTMRRGDSGETASAVIENANS
jgi:hypothetical protein